MRIFNGEFKDKLLNILGCFNVELPRASYYANFLKNLAKIEIILTLLRVVKHVAKTLNAAKMNSEEISKEYNQVVKGWPILLSLSGHTLTRIEFLNS